MKRLLLISLMVACGSDEGFVLHEKLAANLDPEQAYLTVVDTDRPISERVAALELLVITDPQLLMANLAKVRPVYCAQQTATWISSSSCSSLSGVVGSGLRPSCRHDDHRCKMFVCEEYMPPWSDVAPLLSTTSASSYDYFKERCAPSCDLPTPDNHVYPVGNYNLTLSVSAPSFWEKHPTVVPTPAFWAETPDTATITAKLTLDLAGIIIPVASSDIDFFLTPDVGLISQVVDKEDGIYEATYVSGSVPGNVTVIAIAEKNQAFANTALRICPGKQP